MGTCHSDRSGPARVYRFLLWLYPPGFRLRFGAEMLVVFQDSCCAGGEQRATRLDFWILALRDLAAALPGEWWQALIRPAKFDFPIRQWFDSLVIPFTVLSYLAAEGSLGAALIRKPPQLPLAQGYGLASVLARMQSTGLDGTCLAITLLMALLGILIAMITARNNRAAFWTLKLHSTGSGN